MTIIKNINNNKLVRQNLPRHWRLGAWHRHRHLAGTAVDYEKEYVKFGLDMQRCGTCNCCTLHIKNMMLAEALMTYPAAVGYGGYIGCC